MGWEHRPLSRSMKRPAPQVPFTGPDDLVSLEYSRSKAHRLDPSASCSRVHGPFRATLLLAIIAFG